MQAVNVEEDVLTGFAAVRLHDALRSTLPVNAILALFKEMSMPGKVKQVAEASDAQRPCDVYEMSFTLYTYGPDFFSEIERAKAIMQKTIDRLIDKYQGQTFYPDDDIRSFVVFGDMAGDGPTQHLNCKLRLEVTPPWITA
jgi:hypothetical protein